MSDERRTRELHVLQLGGAAILLILAGGRGLPILLERQRAGETAALRATMEAAGAERSVRRLRDPRLANLASREYDSALDSALIHATSASFAGITLSQLVSDVAADDGVDLGSMSARTDSARGRRLVTVGIRAPVKGELSAVIRFLSDLERGPEALVIRELSLAPESTPSGQADPTQLRGELFLEALARIAGPTAGVASR